MPFTEDHSAFLGTADFATSAVFSGTGATVQVIFDADYLQPATMESTGPQAIGRESDFTGAQHGMTLTINDVLYTIQKIEPDGTGMVTLSLRRR